jgi:hypothetical protein
LFAGCGGRRTGRTCFVRRCGGQFTFGPVTSKHGS